MSKKKEKKLSCEDLVLGLRYSADVIQKLYVGGGLQANIERAELMRDAADRLERVMARLNESTSDSQDKDYLVIASALEIVECGAASVPQRDEQGS